MEEDEKKVSADFRIQEEDFIMEPVKGNPWFYNLVFFKRVKKRDTGEYKYEPKGIMYGLTLTTALNRIAHHKTSKKFQDRTITLKEFLREYQQQYKEMYKLCHETLPESRY